MYGTGGRRRGQGLISTLLLGAVVASFCGILYQLTKVLLGAPKIERATDASLFDGVPAMGLMLGTLLIFSLWLPTPLLNLMQQAARIIQGKP